MLINVYATNVDDPGFFVMLAQNIKQHSVSNIVWGGDFNLVLKVKADRNGGSTNNKNTRKILDQYMEDFMLVDIWRLQHPLNSTFTWHRYNPTLSFSRRDFFITNYGLSSLIEKSKVKPGFRSDHTMVRIILCTTDQSRGRGLWKMNTSYLTNKEYIELINTDIHFVHSTAVNLSPDIRWELLKNKITEKSIQ